MSMSPILLLIFVVALAAPLVATNPRKLTDTNVAAPGGTMDDQSKCGGCPCNKPCSTSPPPPPPKKPSPTPSLNCPPPPSYIYITGPPGNVYPVDPYSHSSAHCSGVLMAPLLLVVIGVVNILRFW